MHVTSTPAPARRLVTPAEALHAPEFLGLPAPGNPEKAAALRIARHRFPLPVVKVNGRNMVLVEDIHRFIDSLRSDDPLPVQAPRRRRGRPTNAEVAARRAAERTGELRHG